MTTTATFREVPPNQTDSGSRKWLYPRLATGRYFRGRVGLAMVLLAGLFAGPWVRIAGEPLFLFNVLERRFVFFGVPFWPQDFYLVAIGLLVFIVFIAGFTVVYGRVWCGWACPQTLFMEMVFRPIEDWIEGDHKAKRRLDAAPWTANKIWRKTLKNSLFVLISFVIANTFLAYIIGTDALLAIVTDNPAHHLVGLGAMVVFTGVFYGVFAHLREIVCLVICPYGRLQSALLDKQSIIVAYDDRRGEPRGKKMKHEGFPASSAFPEQPAHGDCIDCQICVQVCPTGIDIRNGLQMECINCTQCMDACDTVMDKIERPRGLIRYDSLEGIETGKPWRMTTRMWAYTAVLALLVGVWVVLLTTRADLSITLLRAPGQLFQRAADGQIMNLYTLDVLNKTSHPITVSLRPTVAGATIRYVQPLTQLAGGTSATATFFIAIPPNKLAGSSLSIPIDLVENGKVVEQIQTRFFNQ
ncbi:cytochrome c oxidase accessory protein CcoG [Fibrella sp. HMF5335]|uniref:Cytochrome c oxidase accessory protein CcoG n=1 Tax=Fibrella rubiginis TaxID=2817060 RepID=A0A939GBQ5_9BACT|nr:cytochrome c oxidase accessory protein CcoG [Fibrella rubiginis]MBO0935431.1 cytochrome c oxidase accessory protein CcoG [Fibrella rubiginis]